LLVTIDKDICTGCQECSEVCPNYAIWGEHGQPQEISVDRCLRCGRCVQKCNSYVSLIEHGYNTYIKKRTERHLPESLSEPLFAANNECNIKKVATALADKDTYTMVQVAPSVREALAEDFGHEFGTFTPGKVASALNTLGFDKVYDTNFFADLTIMEEANELVQRVKNGGVLPMFTSCCPSWVRYLEVNNPELTDHLSSAKSPQQIGGAIFKTYGAKLNNVEPQNVFSVAIMPCTAKAFEAERPEMNVDGLRDVDAVLTTRELAYLIKDADIDFEALEDFSFDAPLGTFSGAGEIFGSSGGVMEAALRTAIELITDKPLPEVEIKSVRSTYGFKEVEIPAGDLTIKVGIVTGLKNIEPLLEKLKAGTLDLHFIEVMTCPSGCVSGGGQPKVLLETEKEDAWAFRRNALYTDDERKIVRKSHENPDIIKLYKEFLGKPLGEMSHKLLHTHYAHVQGASVDAE